MKKTVPNNLTVTFWNTIHAERWDYLSRVPIRLVSLAQTRMEKSMYVAWRGQATNFKKMGILGPVAL